MRPLCAFVTIVIGCVLPAGSQGAEKPAAKEALKALNDFIGEWKGNGAPEKARPTSAELWNETVSWAWRFKGDDAWITLEFKNGKYFKSAELRFLVDKSVYQLTAVDKKDKKLVFDGELKDDYLTLERVDPSTKETQRIVMNLAGDGVRFIYRYSHKPEGRTAFIKDYMVACTKIGESLGKAAKKIECVVSGGLGTIPVSYKGETFYVCCSGCKDAFNENPEKYIAEYKAKKAGKK
jgi:YHS domain